MLVSNSEIQTFLSCQRKHYWAFRKCLAPDKPNSKALTRGIVGHEALETYYRGKKENAPHEYCVSAALEVIDNSIEEYEDLQKDLSQLRDVLVRYFDFYENEPWKVLEVERQYETMWETGLHYGMQLDLLVEVTAGRDKGQIHLVDHKFVYDFWSDRELSMNPQVNKYLRTLVDNGVPVRKGILNQVRYRKLKDPKPDSLFRRDVVVTMRSEMDRYMNEAYRVASVIKYLSELTEAEHFAETLMRIDKETCGKCAYQPLCKLTMQGQDTRLTERTLYTRNKYAEQYKQEKAS